MYAPMGSFVHLSAAVVASWLERPGEELDCFYRFGGVGLSSAVAGGGIYREVLYAYICPLGSRSRQSLCR